MRAAISIALLLAASTASAATFLVPPDRTLVTAWRAIVVATAGESDGRWAPGGWIETVTELSVDEAIKGAIGTGETIHVTGLRTARVRRLVRRIRQRQRPRSAGRAYVVCWER